MELTVEGKCALNLRIKLAPGMFSKLLVGAFQVCVLCSPYNLAHAEEQELLPPFSDVIGRTPTISTYQTGKFFWREFDRQLESRFEGAFSQEWQEFSQGDIWIAYLSDAVDRFQLPKLMIQALSSQNVELDIPITYLRISLTGGRRILLVLVNVDRFREFGDDDRAIDCKVVASTMFEMFGEARDDVKNAYMLCGAKS